MARVVRIGSVVLCAGLVALLVWSGVVRPWRHSGDKRVPGSVSSTSGEQTQQAESLAPIKTSPFSEDGQQPSGWTAGAKRAEKQLLIQGVETNIETPVSARLFGRWTELGEPKTRHHVQAVRMGARSTRQARVLAVTDDAGNYVMHVRPGRYEVGFGRTRQIVSVRPREARRLDHDAAGKASVSVRLTGSGYRKLNARVALTATGEDVRWLAHANTNAAGVALFEGVPAGVLEVRAGLPLLSPGSPVLVRSEFRVSSSDSRVEVTLDPPRGELRIQLHDSGEDPVANAMVEIWTPDGGRRRRLTNDAGTVAFTLVPAGTVKYFVRHRTYATVRGDVSMRDSIRVERIALRPGLDLPVVVTDEGGEALAARTSSSPARAQA